MRTLTTFTLKRVSTAFLTSILLASGWTLNNTCCVLSANNDTFSEINGARMISCCPVMRSTTLRAALGFLACLPRHTKRIVPRLWPKNRAASNPERGAYATGARSTCTFLAPWFLSTPAYQPLGLGGRSTCAPIIELHYDNLVQKVGPGL